MIKVTTDIPEQLTDGVNKEASLCDRLGGVYGSAAVDNLVDGST